MSCVCFLSVAEQDRAKAVTEPNGELGADDQTQMTRFEISLKDERFVTSGAMNSPAKSFDLKTLNLTPACV